MPGPTAEGFAIRASRVGASEVGALLGHHPYTTPADIYARIVEGVAKSVSNTRVQLGIDLEGYVAKRWSLATGHKVMRAWATFPHPDVLLSATPDYYVPHTGLLEVKVDRGGPSDDWVDLPEHVYWQVVAQLACVGRDHGYVAALVGSDLRQFTVDRNGADEARLLAAVHAFEVQHLAPKVPPQPIPGELVLTVAPRTDDVADAVTFDNLQQLGAHLLDTSRLVTSYTAERDTLRDQLARWMADNRKRLVRGEGWQAEVTERNGKRFLTVRDLEKTYRRNAG